MFDYDIVIVGSGPAGLTAAAGLARKNLRVLVLEREDFGGLLNKVEWFRGLGDYPDGVAGPELAGRMLAEAEQCGVTMKHGEVDEIESYSGCRSVSCRDGDHYTASGVIIAGGREPRRLGIPGEKEFRYKGVIHCALCDAALYTGKTVAVCGGGRTGVVEALTMSRYAARVILIEKAHELTAIEPLRVKAESNPKLEFLFDSEPVSISGDQAVEAINVRNVVEGKQEEVPVDGVIISVGTVPATDYLEPIMDLDENDPSIPVRHGLTTDLENVLAAGDIRHGSPLDLATAILDGETAARTLLESLK